MTDESNRPVKCRLAPMRQYKGGDETGYVCTVCNVQFPVESAGRILVSVPGRGSEVIVLDTLPELTLPAETDSACVLALVNGPEERITLARVEDALETVDQALRPHYRGKLPRDFLAELPHIQRCLKALRERLEAEAP